MNPRIGFGIDVHRLEKDEKLIIGNIQIPFHKGTLAHSDGDVLIHAICDALLGAAGLNDIGHYFPDTDEKIKGISSAVILDKVLSIIKEKGYQISNIDCTVVLQNPKISPFIDNIKKRLAEIIKVGITQISVKATTTEMLGFEGRGEGITAYAIVLLN